MASKDEGKAEILNRFFCSVFTQENQVTMPSPPDIHEGPLLDSVTISEEVVREKLLKLNTSRSPGPDGIHPRILKLTALSLCGPLTEVFQKSLRCGILPLDWKKGMIVSVFKKGDRRQPENYRPISLTSIPCKILESIIRDGLMEHLESTGQLSKDQHGFRQRRSCTTQLLEVMEDWTKALEKGEPIDALYLDFSKAFDSVPHQRLLSKLRACGVSGTLLEWIHCFLTGRQQQVVVGGCCSSWSPVTSGVPQGSVIGPTLFLLFINDMPDVLSSAVKMFADDTKVYRPVPLKQDCAALQRDLDALMA